MTNTTRRSRLIIAETLTDKGLLNNEKNILKILEKINESGEDVANLKSLQIERVNETPQTFYIWIYYQAGNGRIYDNQSGKGYKIQLDEMTTAQKIKSAITSKKWKVAHAEHHQTANGWKAEKVKDNKPATLQEIALKESEKNIFYYLFIEERNTRDVFHLCDWDTLSKRATRTTCPGWFWSNPWNLQDCNHARTNAKTIYILKAPKEEGEQMRAKQQQRHKNRRNIPGSCQMIPNERRKLKDISFSWNSCNYRGEGWKVCTVDGVRVYQEPQETQEQAQAEALAQVYDKSGYIRGERIAQLKQKAAQIRADRLKNEWESTDKTEYITGLIQLEDILYSLFLSVAHSKKYDFYTLHRLKDLGECLRDVQRTQKDINDYKTGADFFADFEKLKRMTKKALILAPLAADPMAYGWSWWSLQDNGELLNTSGGLLKKDYYYKITPQGVGVEW